MPTAQIIADDSIGSGGGSAFLWFVAGVSALGGLLFGYDWVVIGGAKPFYEAYFGVVEPQLQAWAMSCALVGCLIGAVGSGALSEALGRRRALLVAALLFAVSAIGTGRAMSFDGFVAWRVIGGLAIGMASVLSPVYIAEIAPAEIRGKLVCLNELTIVLGIVGAQTVNWLIAEPIAAGATIDAIRVSWNGHTAWRHMFEAAVVPAILFFLGALVIPESPRWLAGKGRWADAEAVLARFGGSARAKIVVEEMRAGFAAAPSRDVWGTIRQPRTRRALAIGITLAVLQQWCGINVIFNYAQEVFTAAGYALSAILFNIVVTGVVMCIFTFVAIGTVDRWGRRPLMLIGCAGLAMIYLVLGALYFGHFQGWPLLLLVVAAIGVYAMTLAPITWVILSEIFPNEARGASVAICTTALWAACFILTYTFPLLNASVGTAVTFWIYAGICAGGFVFVLRNLPETKGQSLEEIEQGWDR
ncbi:MAG: sugar porter family MFS transporter [Sphingomonas sp.]|jgi:sugar porter (SP) family MFS transporter|uniref:sugar porter family MFS transporter n=1 Tax=Sphingomonas sp. TaxID=28214 RepID=UPI00356ADBA7